MRTLQLICFVVPGLALALPACNVFNEELAACKTNLECTQRASEGSDTDVAAMCVGEGTEAHCQNLLSDDPKYCYRITAGDGSEHDTNDAYKNDNAILIGSLFETGGATGSGSNGATNLRREESAVLAVQEINKSGGIPGKTVDAPHPLVMVSCDTQVSLNTSASHLIDNLKVPAIVGPNQSQDVLDLLPKNSLSKTAVLSPTGVASSIADKNTEGYTYQMVPNDLQRAAPMNEQINILESAIRGASSTTVRLAVLYRSDALGDGTQRALVGSLRFNNATLGQPPNLDEAVKLFGYDNTDTSKDEMILTQLLTMRPHIIVIAGNQEAVLRFVSGTTVTPATSKLEERWDTNNPTNQAHPFYVGIDSTKNSALFAAGKNTTFGNGFRVRVRGTGVTSGTDAQNVFTQFNVQYVTKYGMQATVSGMGSAYDAVYAIAFAIAGSGDAKAGNPITGDSVKNGMKLLSGAKTDQRIEINQSAASTAFSALGTGKHINAIGTFGAFAWDTKGSKTAGIVEIWCLRQGAAANGSATAASTSRTFDISTNTFTGTYDGDTKCPATP